MDQYLITFKSFWEFHSALIRQREYVYELEVNLKDKARVWIVSKDRVRVRVRSKSHPWFSHWYQWYHEEHSSGQKFKNEIICLKFK